MTPVDVRRPDVPGQRWLSYRTGKAYSWLSGGGGGGGTIRKEGANYVRYEDLYVSGDNLQQTINRVTSNKILTFPEGEFAIPNNFPNGYYDGVRLGSGSWGAACRGLSGSGPNTSFSMATSNLPKWTSTATADPYMLIDAIGPSSSARISVEFSNFSIRGTDLGQGNEYPYQGLRLEKCTNSLIENVFISGITGTMNYPPGETGSVNLFDCVGSSWDNPAVTINNLEVDGRRGGVKVSSSPVMINACKYMIFNSPYLHHARCGGGGLAWWWCEDGQVNNGRSEHIGSGTGTQTGYCFNHEESTRITYDNPIMVCGRGQPGDSPSSLHMSLNSATGTGGPYWGDAEAPDCILTVNNPTWDATAVGGGQFCVETWNQGAANRQHTAAVVTGANGFPLPYVWINGNA